MLEKIDQVTNFNSSCAGNFIMVIRGLRTHRKLLTIGRCWWWCWWRVSWWKWWYWNDLIKVFWNVHLWIITRGNYGDDTLPFKKPEQAVQLLLCGHLNNEHRSKLSPLFSLRAFIGLQLHHINHYKGRKPRQNCHLKICEYWLSFTNTVSPEHRSKLSPPPSLGAYIGLNP